MPSVTTGAIVAEKYRVEWLLGRGAMGYVVAARHLELDRLVAIKFLQKHALAEDTALARFRHEAKACGKLESEHIAKVFDVGTHGEEPFLVMEHLEGSDLDAVAKKRGVFGLAEACDYLLQAAAGLAEAHSLGIVHRDIKPANLFLTRTSAGEPLLKIVDFGLSKTVKALDGDMTQSTAVLGSPKYMSPEQMTDSRDVDARTDIWSLGVCLYRLLGGELPFDGSTIGKLCTMVLHEDPKPLRELRPEIHPELELVVATCLQKDRTARFANVAELGAALAPFVADVDHAVERVEAMAALLGVRPPPLGYRAPTPSPRALPSPQPIPTPAPTPVTATVVIPKRPATDPGPEPVVASAPVRPRFARLRQADTFALVAGFGFLALTSIGYATFARSSPRSAAAEEGAPPMTTPVTAASPVGAPFDPPPVAPSEPPPAPIPAPPSAVSPSPLLIGTTAPGNPAPGSLSNSTKATPAGRKPHRASAPRTSAREDEPRLGDGTMSIPGDRK